MTEIAEDTLARTLYGEARGELYGGKCAVACVIINRVISPRVWWGDDVVSVCRYPYQFSCWNESDINRSIIERISDEEPTFKECLDIAHDAVTGALIDITFGSCNYHAKGISPAWARGKTPVIRIGGHIFYNDVE